MRRLFFFMLFCALLHLNGAEPLKVGMELSYPPFETVCEDGKPCGISVDIAEALGAYLGRPVEISNISFVGLIPSLNSNKIDMIISSLTRTPRREKVIAFSEPYAKTGLCLLLNVHSKIENIDEANDSGVSIVVKLGTSGETYAAKEMTEATVRVLDKEGLCVLEVIQGKADAFIYDQLSVFRSWQKNLKTTRALLKPFQEEHWAIGLRKDDTELLREVNAFITEFRKSGGFDALVEKYLPNEKAAFKNLGIPFIF